MLILGIAMLIVFIGGVGAVAKHANRPVRTGGRAGGGPTRGNGRTTSGGRTGGAGTSDWARTTRRGPGANRRRNRGGWVIKAWNASGAPRTSEATLGGAAAVVTGKAAGATARGTVWAGRRAGRGGRWATNRALGPFDRWLTRTRDGLETAETLPNRPTTTEPTGPRPVTPETQPQPAATPPPVHVNPFRSNKGEPVDTSAPTTFDRAAVTSTLAAHLNHIAELEPENDADLLNFLKDEVTGMLAYAEAVNTMFEHCVQSQGLDPAAMQGVSDYAEAFTENAEAAANGHKQFLSVYEAIIEAASNGTQFPYNGRFFSGEAA